MAIEIERKFLIQQVPQHLIDGLEPITIFQGYLAIHEDFTEVRIRRMNNTFWQTIKTRGDALSRMEFEIPIEKKLFEQLWPITQGRNLRKTRYLLPFKEWIIDLDIYEENLSGLVVAEVEFENRTAAENFEPPPWFSKELTGNITFKNFTLATQGLPKK